ncbi:MAG: peptidylprolyl isomerase [Persephonella sp.]|nr:peptidylprolyl isomerase [Persephonella sp.]
MKKILMAFFGFMAFAYAYQGFGWKIDPEMKKKIVAEVGDKKITEMDVQRYMKVLLPMNFYHRNLTEEKKKELRKKALNYLINRELLYYEAKKKGIKVPENQIDKLMEELEKRYKSKKNLERMLKETGITLKQFREELKKRLMIDQLLNKYVNVKLTDEQLREYYEKNKYKFKEPEALKIRYIYIKVDPSKPKGRQIAKERAEKAYKEIMAGKDFGDVAYRYSDDLSRIKGGEIGFVHKGRFEKKVEEEIYKLKVGQVSKIIETELGFHIIKIEGKRPSRIVSFEQIKEKLRKELTDKLRKEKYEALLNDAKRTLKW